MPSSVKLFLSDAAAKTVMLPVALSLEVVVVGAADDVSDEELSEELQPVTRASEKAPAATSPTTRFTNFLQYVQNYGVSTMTVVAFTIATPILPTSSPSSRTASVLINETTVKGPHCIST